MFIKHIILFTICVICGVNGQYDLEDVCETNEGKAGICRYEHVCKYAKELLPKEIHPTDCSYEDKTLIVCCPEDHESGILSRLFEGTKGVISNTNVTCHYDGYLPLICCPNTPGIQQPPEPRGCPPLPVIQTPVFNKVTHTIAWEKCVGNQHVLHVCEQQGRSYTRYETCAIPLTAQRVSGGVPAGAMEFPHMAVLGCDNPIETDDNEISWVGGGSLISDKFILTAGHVLISSFGQLRYAFLGSLDKTDVRGGELYGIIKLIPHKRYTSKNKNDDIALVELNRRVTFSSFIRPICLPVPGIDPEDDIRIIAGWGEAGHKLSSTNLLQKAIISEVNGNECKNSLVWDGFVWNDDTMICARGWKDLHGVTDSCQGDSGGPLMYKVTNKEFSCNYVVAGVVSWGGVCSTGTPAAYTRVSAYVDWIVEKVWPEELNKANAGSDLDNFYD